MTKATAVTTNVEDIDVKALISPDYYELNDHLEDGTNDTHNWLKGGRGSLKSSFAGTRVVLGIMEDPLAHAYVFRKVGDTCRNSVFNEYQKIIARLPDGVQACWREQINPLQLIYTDPKTKLKQYILFKGGDKPKKVKSATFPRGYVKFIHYEEADEFTEPQDFRTINLSLLRGLGKTKPAVFYTFNPPKHRGHWLNKHVAETVGKPNNTVLHTDYITIAILHPDWLGQEFLEEAAHARKYNRLQYDWEFLGLDVATGNEIFNNLERREITAEEREAFESYRKAGIDFGFSKDPLCYLDGYFDRKRDVVYLWGEVYATRLSNKEAVKRIKARNPSTYKDGATGRLIKADAAEPRSINEFYNLGLNITRCTKGKGSIDHGIKWLSDRTKIIIDIDSPNTWREFSTYSLEFDKTGNAKGGYPDKDNHSIDTARYTLEDYIRDGGFEY